MTAKAGGIQRVSSHDRGARGRLVFAAGPHQRAHRVAASGELPDQSAAHVPCAAANKDVPIRHDLVDATKSGRVSDLFPTRGNGNFWFRKPDDETIRHEDREHSAVHQRQSNVGFDQPVVVNHPGQRAEVDQPVQPLPSLVAEASYHGGGRRCGQRNHKREPRHARGDEPPFDHVRQHLVHIEKLVEPDPCHQVQASVKEREQPQHPAEPDQLRLIQESAQRGDRQCNQEEPNGPITGIVGDVLDRICGQFLLVAAPAEIQQRRQTYDKN